MHEEAERNETVCLWMSFSDDDGFRGVVITETLGLSHAVEKTHMLGINPGGQIRALEVEPSLVDRSDFNRLLTKTELIAAGYIL